MLPFQEPWHCSDAEKTFERIVDSMWKKGLLFQYYFYVAQKNSEAKFSVCPPAFSVKFVFHEKSIYRELMMEVY